MSDSTVVEPRLVVQAFPSLDELTARILEPLGDPAEQLELLDAFCRSAIGEVSREHWAARFESPPTVENIGTLWVFIDQMKTDLGLMRSHLESLEGSMSGLDVLRMEGRVGGEDD